MKLIIHYDEKTTAIISKFKEVLEEYEIELISKIGLPRANMHGNVYRDFINDPTRMIITNQITKVQSLSIPTKLELIYEEGDKGFIIT